MVGWVHLSVTLNQRLFGPSLGQTEGSGEELCDDSSIAPQWAPNLVGFEVVTAQPEVVPELLT